MSRNQLAQKLKQGQVCLGLCNTYPAPGIIEGMCKGWDFVWIDGQHGEMSYDSILGATQVAMAAEVDSLIRVPSHEHGTLCRYADLAPSAIMVPMVNTAAEAEQVVRGLRFPPRGVRSFGGRRSVDLYGRDYHTMHELLVVVQIETMAALANAEEIAAVDGVDVLFLGPDDVKLSMGIPVNTPMEQDDRIRQAMERTAQAARAAGKTAALPTGSQESSRLAIELGYRMLVGGSDIGFLRTRAAERLQELTQLVDETTTQVV